LKKFIKKVLLLLVLFSLLLGGYSRLYSIAATTYNGMSTADRIRKSFQNSVQGDYNCYFLGNSRIYRGLNPEKFSSVSAYNFGHDNDSFNQMYYKLCYLLDNGKNIEYLIIGTDYFQFSFLSDTRNYVYSALFPAAYREDFDAVSVAQQVQQFKENVITRWRNMQTGVAYCLELLRGVEPPQLPYQKENGQYIAWGHATGTETVDRDYTVLPIQYDYYTKILELCEKENIKLYIVMPPLWEGETASHTDEERAVLNAMIQESLEGTGFEGHYINYSEEEGLLPYEDFIDVSHLTPEAADDFSAYISQKIFGESA
jgi:hypothetical protein